MRVTSKGFRPFNNSKPMVILGSKLKPTPESASQQRVQPDPMQPAIDACERWLKNKGNDNPSNAKSGPDDPENRDED